MAQQSINMRDFKITKNKDEWYFATVIDTYGNKYDNWFEHAHEANNWIYYIWEKEEWFNSVNSQELLANAIENCGNSSLMAATFSLLTPYKALAPSYAIMGSVA